MSSDNFGVVPKSEQTTWQPSGWLLRWHKSATVVARLTDEYAEQERTLHSIRDLPLLSLDPLPGNIFEQFP